MLKTNIQYEGIFNMYVQYLIELYVCMYVCIMCVRTHSEYYIDEMRGV